MNVSTGPTQLGVTNFISIVATNRKLQAHEIVQACYWLSKFLALCSLAGGGALPRWPGSDRCADGVLPGLLPARPLQRRPPLRPPQKAKRRPDQEADRLRQGVRGVLPPAVCHLQV